MKRNLVCSLFLNDRIRTTEARAKAIRGNVDRVVTWAKRGDLHSRRLALKMLNDKEVVREVFEKVEQGMWADRTCGFTRITKLGPRKGDNAPMVIMELVTEPCTPKKKAEKVVEAAPVAAPVADEVVEAPVAEEAAEAAEAAEEKTEA
jgi:large subunit ribosomal protein L17